MKEAFGLLKTLPCRWATVPKMSDATLARLIRPRGRMCWSHNAFMSHPPTVPKCRMRCWRVLPDLRGGMCWSIMRSYRIQLLCPKCRMRCWRSYPTYGERMCWSHNAFMSHQLLYPKCRMRRWRVLSDLRGACVGRIRRLRRIRQWCPNATVLSVLDFTR